MAKNQKNKARRYLIFKPEPPFESYSFKTQS